MEQTVHRRIKATSHSAIFRTCKYAIKDTDDILSANRELKQTDAAAERRR